MKIIKKIKLEKGFHFVAINQKTNTIYVSNNGSDVVLVIDGNTFKIIDKIKIKQPRQIVINSKTDSLGIVFKNVGPKTMLGWFKFIPYSGFGAEFIMIDSKSHETLGHQKGAIKGIDIDEESNIAYFSSGYSKSIFVMDCSDCTVKRKIDLEKISKGICFDPSTKSLFVAHPSSDLISIIDTRTNSIAYRIKVPGPSKVLVNSNSNQAFVLEREANYPVEGRAEEFDTLFRINLKNMKITNEFPKRNKVINFLWGTQQGYCNFALNSKTNRVYFAHEKKNNLFTFDSSFNIIKKTKIPNMSFPSIAVNPSTNRIFLASSGWRNSWLYVLEDD